MKDGFIKVAAGLPKITLADTLANTEEIKRIILKAEDEKVNLLVLPELCVTGATCEDLFFNETLISTQGQAYATAIHEMTHHAQNIKLFSSESVLKTAFKKLGVTAKSKVAVNLKIKTVGSMKESDYNHADELVAYAIERQMTGRTNPLTEAVYAVLKEKGVIK